MIHYSSNSFVDMLCFAIFGQLISVSLLFTKIPYLIMESKLNNCSESDISSSSSGQRDYYLLDIQSLVYQDLRGETLPLKEEYRIRHFHNQGWTCDVTFFDVQKQDECFSLDIWDAASAKLKAYNELKAVEESKYTTQPPVKFTKERHKKAVLLFNSKCVELNLHVGDYSSGIYIIFKEYPSSNLSRYLR